jgi:hypothetical protein
MDDLGLEQAVDRRDQRIVVAVANASDGWFDTGFSQPLGIADRTYWVDSSERSNTRLNRS